MVNSPSYSITWIFLSEILTDDNDIRIHMMFHIKCNEDQRGILFYLEFGKEIPGYGVTRTIHHLDVKIKCKIE